MPISPVASNAVGFADGNAGHVYTLPSGAPTVGDLDIIAANSNTVINSVSGFTKITAASALNNQDAQTWYRLAVGGEGATATITTAGDHDAALHWSRWRGVAALDVATKATVDASAGSTTPTVSTGTLAATGELVLAVGAVHGAVTTAPNWTAWSGATPLTAVTQGSGASTSTSYVAYKLGAGTAAEASSVSWTTPAPDRYILVTTWTASAGQSVTLGQAVETDTAQAISRAKRRTLGQASEADTSAAISRAKARTMGQTAETDSALQIGRLKSRALGQPSETDTARAITRTKARTLGRATETDTAMPLVGVNPGADITISAGPPTRAWAASAPARGWSARPPTI
ncbi:MAG: hypothetical protein JWN52_8080 [Actinomycetia bacterium]|nr:hypothetical protein [Actinomycetes bacterium]